MRIRDLVAVTLVITLTTTSGCTENRRARTYGGTTYMDIAAGQRVLNATWKDANLWVLTRPLREGEAPEVLTFHETSAWGVLEGTIVLREHAVDVK